MEFNFSEYYGRLIISPMFFIVLAFVYLIYFIVKYKKERKKENSEYKKAYLIFSSIIFLMICSIGFATMKPKLMFEKEENKVLNQGIIDEIITVNYPTKFTYQDAPVNPSIILVNGEEYFIMYIGYFKIGDNVIIEYLPKSHVVLSINENP